MRVYKDVVKALGALAGDSPVFEQLVCDQDPERARLLGELLGKDAQALRWSDVDTKRGTVRGLKPGKDAMQALRTFKQTTEALRALSDSPEARVFEGMVLDGSASERLREHLKLAGVDRRELFVESSKR